MNPTWFEIPAVVVILVLVGIVVIRAFTAPLPGAEDPVDIFMRRHLPDDSMRNSAAWGRESPDSGERAMRSHERR